MNNSSKACAWPSVGYECFHNWFFVSFEGIKAGCPIRNGVGVRSGLCPGARFSAMCFGPDS